MAYGSDADFNDFLTSMGLTLPAGAPDPAVLRAVGSAYLDAMYGARYSGQVADVEQDAEWPRVNAFRGFAPLPSDLIPKAIIQASYFAAYYAAQNPDAFFTGGTASSLVKRETVGPLTFEYAVPSNPEQVALLLTPILPMTDGLVMPYLLNPNAKGVSITALGGC